MGYKVKHPEGYLLDKGLDESDAKALAVRVFDATGEPCELINVADEKDTQTFPAPEEKKSERASASASTSVQTKTAAKKANG
jgi:hypothetical protein